MTSGRNSIGVEIDENFQQVICPLAHHIADFSNDYLHDRLRKHFAFVEDRIQNSGALKYTNKHYSCPVVTRQEQFILLNGLKEVQARGDNIFDVIYTRKPQAWDLERSSEALVGNKMKPHAKPFQLSIGSLSCARTA